MFGTISEIKKGIEEEKRKIKVQKKVQQSLTMQVQENNRLMEGDEIMDDELVTELMLDKSYQEGKRKLIQTRNNQRFVNNTEMYGQSQKSVSISRNVNMNVNTEREMNLSTKTIQSLLNNLQNMNQSKQQDGLLKQLGDSDYHDVLGSEQNRKIKQKIDDISMNNEQYQQKIEGLLENIDYDNIQENELEREISR